MKSAQKFLFDTSFDPQQQTAAKPAAGRGKPQPEPEPTFSKAELEAARAEGFAAGLEQGQSEAQASGEQTVAKALAAIDGSVQALLLRQEEALAENERNAYSAGVTIVRKLFPRLAAREAIAEIEQVVGDCLRRLRTEPRIVVRVSDPLLDELRDRLDALAQHAGFEGKFVLLADETLALDAVRVEWADGGAERNSQQIWQAIDGVLGRVIGDTATDGQPEPAPAETATAETDGKDVHQGAPQPPAAPTPAKTAASEPPADGEAGLSQQA